MVTWATTLWKASLIFICLTVTAMTPLRLSAQAATYNYFYRVYFRDKGNQNPANFRASDLISVKAQKRRDKAGIPYPVINDLPVNQEYIKQVISKGFTLHCTSKWLNTALFKTINQDDINLLLSLPFVSNAKIVKRPVGKGLYPGKLDLQLTNNNDNPPFNRPITMLNGQLLHNSGFNGDGILIAVLDGGFIKADQISSLENLRARNGIKGTYDMILRNKYVYNYHYHGTGVLSVLAGDIPEYIEGSAPGADYWLIRTEDTNSEFPVEEDYWAAGAEYADSLGADIISSSLGYYKFDDPVMNYKFSEMNGKSTFVSRAAEAAASKGILVVNSAGNERTNEWKRIIAPSDGDSVLAAGAVDGNNFISSFSSAGPSADGRVKPDNAAHGVSVVLQIEPQTLVRANGTSFSCPVLSGMCACLMQAVPKALNMNIIDALHKNGDRYNKPDSLYGYGIPDMVNTLKMLQDYFVTKPDDKTSIGPNPFTENLEVTFREVPGTLRVQIFNTSGKQLINKFYYDYIGRRIAINDLQNAPEGLYFVKLTSSSWTVTHKVVKLRE
jgi:serine protease AprX